MTGQRVRAAFTILIATLCLPPARAAAQATEPTSTGSSLDELLEVKISGAAKSDQTARQAPASVTIITSEDIERYGYRTIADVLMTVRGFFVSYDRNYTYVGVRGFSRPTDYNNRILLLLDGHTMNENVYGAAELGSEFPIELDVVDHIEIIRGPGSALYGTGAMLAVVKVFLKKGSALNGGRLALGGGSYGRRQGTISAGKEREHGRSGAELTNSPDQSFKLGPSCPLSGPLHLSGELLDETGRRTVQDSRTASYFLSNLTLSADAGRIPVRVLAQVRNLFDVDYSTPGGFEHRQAAIGQDGRNYGVRLEYRF